MASKMNFEGVDQMRNIKNACSRIFQNQKDIEGIRELQKSIKDSSSTVVKTLEPIILPVIFLILKKISENKSSFKEKDRQEIVDTLKSVLEKIEIEKLPLFFNIYGFLLYEIYDHEKHAVLGISEEYKLSIVECMTTLSKSLSHSALETLYVKDNAPKLCQMIYTVLEIAKNEQYKFLRIAAIECIMAMAQVLDDNDFNDVVMRNHIAEVFQFFLPGVASQLKHVALIDEKNGHKIPLVALKAWGRIVTLLMQDYNAIDQKITLNDTNYVFKPSNKKFENEKEIREYIQNAKRIPQWYKETDKKLQQIIIEFSKLTHHSHPKVRLELVNMSLLIVQNCVHTMPTSVSHLIDIVISLSEDDDTNVSHKSREILNDLSEKLVNNEFKNLLDNLEESFYSLVQSMPRKFNSVDERVQIVTLNSLIGYINLFGRHSLTQILHSSVHLNKLILTLIHISEFDKSSISILEEYSTPDFELRQDLVTSWKNFRHFKEPSVLKKIENVCKLLSKYGASSIVSHFLLDMIVSDPEHRKEAIFLLNEIATEATDFHIFKNVIATYTDNSHWYLPLSVIIDDYGYEHTLSDIQNNIIQICLLVEGIGKVALAMNKKFEQFLLKTLYLVLERAGSAHFLIRSAGLQSLTNISISCGYSSITDLINANIDYFSFHIERKLNKAKGNTGGLDVLSVVIKYSTKEVLNSTCDVVHELLLKTYDQHRTYLNSYFQVFKMFILGLYKWVGVEDDKKFKTKKQKQEEYEEFRVSNIEPIEDFSDDIMGKTAEEMYKEDMEKNKEDLESEEQEYKKPEPPIYIKLTVAILARSLHYLPSKDRSRKLLVLEILKNALPLLKKFEDDLLPIVHQIWSPLVDRFKENDPLIIFYSFQLLCVLAKLSKEFIRSRTSKEVLPDILTTLDNLVQESYLKDKGSAYRYSHNYKLQLIILENLALVIGNLDMLQKDSDKAMEVVFKYISDKQPVPLQTSALLFFKTVIMYDPKPSIDKVTSLIKDVTPEFEKNTKELIKYCQGYE